MNPTVQALDPKLQETYNRVMGTELTPKGGASLPASGSGQAWKEPVRTAAPVQTPSSSPTVAAPTTAHVSAKKGLPWWIFLLAGLVFFVLYTFFWARMFNVI